MDVQGVRTCFEDLKKGTNYDVILFSCSVVSDSLLPHGLQHTRLSYLSVSPGVCSK